MSDGKNSIADDILRNGFERWQRLEGEKQAISDDLKELFAELKSQGFDGKALRAAFRTVAKASDMDVQEHNAIVELYVDSLMGPRPSAVGTENANAQARSAQADPVAQIRANPAMAIVDASNIKKKSEPQPLTQAGSDLTTPQALNGQVATHSDIDNPISTDTQESRRAETPEGTGQSAPSDKADDAGKSAGAKASAALAPKYAAPGVVTWETYPPEGVTRSAVSIAFANIGQDAVVIKDDLANGHAQPIVKIGKEILDGWARFMTARDMTEMDGKPLSYAVVQYDGTDPLIDAIRWNVEGRVLDEGQKRKIAATLARQNPSRKDDIYRAFELWMEPV
jgi:uncharacterized protein (UPF0335 family)